MGSKGNIEKGGYRRDYDIVTWSDTRNFIFIDQIIFIEKKSFLLRKNYNPSLIYMQKKFLMVTGKTMGFQ